MSVVRAGKWRAKTLKDLKDLQQQATDLQIRDPATLTFPLSDLSDPVALRARCEEAKEMVSVGTPAIYCFELENPGVGEALMEAFEDRLRTCCQTEKTLKYSRANKGSGSNALYVGSSKSFASRFSQHLGRIGGPGTYSMRLANWAKSIPAFIEVSLWSFDTGTSQAVLELYEQALWDLKEPRLGKRSGK